MLEIKKFNLKKINLSGKYSISCSYSEKNELLSYLLKIYKIKGYDIYNYKLNLDFGIEIKSSKDLGKLNENHIIFSKLYRPYDYIVFKDHKKFKNMITFVSGPDYLLGVKGYNILFFEKKYIFNKKKIFNLYIKFNKYKIKEEVFDSWWNNINKKWIIIKTNDFSYFLSDNIKVFFYNEYNKKKNLTFMDFLFDYYN